ncbi:uncharacterized protein LOC112091896 [Morus notabilis]|uniref:uncharacterized protein LOC112091896 n=1 Tax=Morus notabilis TaxID=981085 RepID=UPI000CED5B7F|nr:uncharacterized protein LOC112091896 [Morus notabilis]
MPNYAKFMKEVMSKKRKLEDYETVKLTEECSAIIKRQLPEKLKDPGCFTIPCTIGGSTFERALCDLGASINLIPLSVFRKLGLGEVTPTTISWQMADRSITYPWGIIEDVLVKVDKFIFPVDFVVLDMEEDQEIPIILGRPFLATGRALIDVHSGNLTLRVNEEKAIFNILNPKRSPQEKLTCNQVEELKSCIKEFTQEVMPKDSLGNGPTNSLTIKKLSNEHCPKKDDVGEYIVKKAEAIATPMNNEMVVAKKKHDQRTSWQDLTPGQRVLLFNSQLKLSPEKVESRLSGTFKIKRVFSFCTIELEPGG